MLPCASVFRTRCDDGFRRRSQQAGASSILRRCPPGWCWPGSPQNCGHCLRVYSAIRSAFPTSAKRLIPSIGAACAGFELRRYSPKSADLFGFGWCHSRHLSSAPACAKAVAQQVQKSNLRARSYFPGASAQTQHWRGFAGFWRRSYGRQNCCETCCGMRGKVRGNLFGNSGLSSELFLLPTSRSPASARVCRLSSSEVSPPCCSETRSEMLSICVPICVLKTVPPGQELSIGAACGVIWCVPTGIDWTAPAACKRAFCCLPADGRFDCYTPCYSPGVTALTMRSPWGCRPRQCWVPALTMARSPCGHHGPGSSASTGFPRSRSAPDVRPLGPLDDACRTARAVADIAIAVGPE